MNPAEIEVAKFGISEFGRLMTIAVPVALTGLFGWLAGQRTIRLEIAKLKEEHGFEARSKYYDFLRQQFADANESYAALNRSLETLLGGYMNLLAQVKGAQLAADGDERLNQWMREMLQEPIETIAYFLRSNCRELQRIQSALLQRYRSKFPDDSATITELQDVKFPSETELNNLSFAAVRENTFRLQEIAAVLRRAASIQIERVMSEQLSRYFDPNK